MEKNIDFAKQFILPKLKGYEFNFRYFSDDGDFGSLKQIEFDSKKYGGTIDFWSMNWLGIFVWDKIGKVIKMNIMLSPQQEKQKEDAFERLQELLI